MGFEEETTYAASPPPVNMNKMASKSTCSREHYDETMAPGKCAFMTLQINKNTLQPNASACANSFSSKRS